MGQKQTLSVTLEHVPISFPLQQRCAEQPLANLGEGRQRERDGLYRSQWCFSICPRAWGEISALCASAPSIPNIWATLSADSQQCTQQGMEICTQQGVEISTRVAAQARWCAGVPEEAAPCQTPTSVGGANPQAPVNSPPVEVPHTTSRKGLSCTGPCVELQSNGGHRTTSQAAQDNRHLRAGEETATQRCHAAANRTWATQAGMGEGQDLKAIGRDIVWEGRQAGSSSALDQLQPRCQSNGLTPGPNQENKTSRNELAAQVCALLDSLGKILYIFIQSNSSSCFLQQKLSFVSSVSLIRSIVTLYSLEQIHCRSLLTAL